MPELPEVETVRLGLAQIVNVPIQRCRVNRRDVVRDLTERRRGTLDLADLLQCDKISSTRRHGKQLALIGHAGRVVLIHLGMSGQLLVLAPGERVEGGHAHVAWSFTDGRRLVFRDPRRFGGVWLLLDQAALDDRWSRLGVDGLSATGQVLNERLARSRRSVKAVLLDQQAIAGVGNIYADEGLFNACINPARLCSSLNTDDWARLAQSLQRVFRAGLQAGGSTLRDYRRPDGSSGQGSAGHLVYGRSGLPCTRCGQVLASGLLAQRTTVWCSRCQQ